ncbi:MAG: hypothetical protein K8S13_11960 [Desulfobacula sp.]|nr:hypothetical protein [Desulfobacula sp.]
MEFHTPLSLTMRSPMVWWDIGLYSNDWFFLHLFYSKSRDEKFSGSLFTPGMGSIPSKRELWQVFRKAKGRGLC